MERRLIKFEVLEIELEITVPERNLWAGVLERAIRDVLNFEKREVHYHRQACAWFFETDSEVRSFLWICKELDLDFEKVRSRIFEMKEKRGTLQCLKLMLSIF